MQAVEPVVRTAEEADGEAIAAIYAPYVQNTPISFETEPPTPEVMAARIARTLETHPWFVAEYDGKVVGYAYAGKHRERAAYRWTVDTTIYVDAVAHRRGIGQALYRALLNTLRQQAFRSAFAEIVLPNPGSIRLHEAVGFRSVGVHKNIGFKLGRWHDIGYWCLGLAEAVPSPCEPIPFAAFRRTPAFALPLGRSAISD
jgi:phosphinothricin acetyltransferase